MVKCDKKFSKSIFEENKIKFLQSTKKMKFEILNNILVENYSY